MIPTPPYRAPAVSKNFALTDPWVRWVNALVAFVNNGGPGAVNTVETVASRALVAADFNGSITILNSVGVIAVTVPTLADMGLSSTPGTLLIARFEVLGGGVPTFAGEAGVTINGVAGPATVLPLGGAPVTYGLYTLMQTGVSDNEWSLQ